MGGNWGRGGEGTGEEGGNGASEARRGGRGVGEDGGKDGGRERGWGGRGGAGEGRHVEEKKGEVKESWPACQSMQGLWRANQGNPRISLKWPSGMIWQVRRSVWEP